MAALSAIVFEWSPLRARWTDDGGSLPGSYYELTTRRGRIFQSGNDFGATASEIRHRPYFVSVRLPDGTILRGRQGVSRYDTHPPTQPPPGTTPEHDSREEAGEDAYTDPPPDAPDAIRPRFDPPLPSIHHGFALWKWGKQTRSAPDEWPSIWIRHGGIRAVQVYASTPMIVGCSEGRPWVAVGSDLGSLRLVQPNAPHLQRHYDIGGGIDDPGIGLITPPVRHGCVSCLRLCAGQGHRLTYLDMRVIPSPTRASFSGGIRATG